MNTKILKAVGMLIGCMATGSAFAAQPVPVTRTFDLDSTSFFSGTDDDADILLFTGDGNLTGNANNGNIPTGWSVIRDNNGSGVAASAFNLTSAGSFSVLDGNVWNTYSNIAIGIKVGNSNSPSWAVFELEKFAQSGVWSTLPVQGGGLSHYLVYGQTQSTTPTVPVPGAAWLLGSGLMGLVAVSRKKQSK
jgi:hypothetical protein